MRLRDLAFASASRNMEKRVASILLILSVAGRLLAAAEAASSGDADTIIRLPSNSNGEEDDRPWECCDNARCTRKHPPSCQCLDRVDKCSDACKECVSVEFGSEVCADWYRGTPPPKCHDKKGQQNNNRIVAPGGLPDLGVEVIRDDANATTAPEKKKDDKTRPWKCCDLQVCTKSEPPICHCGDKVERCAKACKRCKKVETTSGGHAQGKCYYRCHDAHRGDPAPPCTRP